jgi:N-acetylglucosamine kinase-like BadF-type ATPase
MLLLGIDGGASKTRGVMVDPEGGVVARAQAAGSAIVGKPNPRSCSVLASLVDSLCADSGITRDGVWHCGLGLNGVDFEDDFAVQHADISAALGLPRERITLVNDGIVALWAATSAAAATMLQHGSGFTAAYRSRIGEERTFDHLGVTRVFDIREGLMVLLARMITGQVDPTPLKDRALAFFGIADEGKYAEAVYRDTIPGRLRKSTPPLIYDAWVGGDAGAASLVESAMGDYVQAARAMIRKTGERSPVVVFGGGVINCAPAAFWDQLTHRLQETHPDLVAKRPEMAPEVGAAVMASHHVGVEPQALFEKVRVSVRRSG